jgi:YggT family protein
VTADTAGLFIIFALEAYAGVLFLRIIVSILQSLAGFSPPDWMRPAVNFLFDATEPFLRIFRGLLPAMRMGGLGLDLSPILAFIVIRILIAIVSTVFF